MSSGACRHECHWATTTNEALACSRHRPQPRWLPPSPVTTSRSAPTTLRRVRASNLGVRANNLGVQGVSGHSSGSASVWLRRCRQAAAVAMLTVTDRGASSCPPARHELQQHEMLFSDFVDIIGTHLTCLSASLILGAAVSDCATEAAVRCSCSASAAGRSSQMCSAALPGPSTSCMSPATCGHDKQTSNDQKLADAPLGERSKPLGYRQDNIANLH